MPRNPNYANGIIYKICCKNPEFKQEYVGSTTSFKHRKAQHKHNCTSPISKSYNYYVYSFIRENGGWDNWKMIEVEKYQALDKNDLDKRERHWVETLKSTLNQHRLCLTEDEKLYKETRHNYIENNRDKINDRRRTYYDKNKEHINELRKSSYIENKDVINEKRRQLASTDEFKQKKSEQDRLYREKNKERIICECGREIYKLQSKSHIKTLIHQKYLENKI